MKLSACIVVYNGYDEALKAAQTVLHCTRRYPVTLYLVPQYTAIHAWHRAAHRDLKPALWQTGNLLKYFHKWGFKW